MPWALKVQERGVSKPAHPQPSQQEIAFHPAEHHLGLNDSRERGGLPGSGFVLPDSSEELSDSLPCRCAASGSSKDRAAGRQGSKRRLGLRCQNTVLHLLPDP